MAAEEDEIDVLGDFSFDSCLAQNTQGIPSCSDREDTVHPQWLLDGTAANWYDSEKNRNRLRKNYPSSIVLSGNRKNLPRNNNAPTLWSSEERNMLDQLMSKYGRDAKKISQVIKTKTEAEIRALIEAEHGIQLETPSHDEEKTEFNHEDIPLALHEEIITDDTHLNEVISMVTTGNTTVPSKSTKSRTKNSLLKPNILEKPNKPDLIAVNPSEIFYEDDLTIGSTESVGIETDTISLIPKRLQRKNKIESKLNPKQTKKIGNHRRKVSRNYDRLSPKSRNRSNELKSPGRQRKDSGLSEESTRSPKMQIVLGSGQALPVCEGEEVIKIEKRKESDPESDIEVDIDSDCSDGGKVKKDKRERDETKEAVKIEEPIAVPLANFEPMPRRQKKINLDGGGGYTIMHTEAGDLFSVGLEPKRERVPKKEHIELIRCELYNADNPAPYEVCISVSALIAMEVQAHASSSEVMGLAGGELRGATLAVRGYRAAAAAASRTHCDMDPLSQAQAAESLRSAGLSLVGWHHSHPGFPAHPSRVDVTSQAGLQAALERPAAPFVAIVTSQHWPHGRSASQYKCFRVETTSDGPTGFALRSRVTGDITRASLPRLHRELKAVVRVEALSGFCVKPDDVCPDTKVTYLDKCISSVRHHLRSAGYSEDDHITSSVINIIQEVFR